MGNKVAAVSLIGTIAAAVFAAFIILNPSPAAASRGEEHASSRASFAFGIIDMVNERLCERQKALASRLPVQLVHPSKCLEEPEPEDPTVTLSAEPATIEAGGSSTLSWDSESAESCEAVGGWSDSTDTSGSESVSPEETTTYTITCEGEGGETSASATVTVEDEPEPEAPTVEITADPATITAGASSTLTWTSENADSCTASNGWNDPIAVDGTQNVSPTVTTTYDIECTGNGGTANDSVTVTVNPAEPEQGTLIVRKVVIRDHGGTAATSTFSFQVNGGGAMGFDEDGEVSMSVDAGTYSVTEVAADGWTTALDNCTNVEIADDETEICTITNDDIEAAPDAPTVSITASRTTVFEGSVNDATTTLTWDSTNADSCEASNAWSDPIGVDGEMTVTPIATSTYAIECFGAGGTTTDSVTVDFVPVPRIPSEADVVVNEIAWMGMVVDGATSTDAEWIELRNLGGSSIDIADWTLTFATTSIAVPDEIDLSVCANTIVPANGFYLLVRASIATTTLDADCVYPSGSATALANNGEIVTLVDAADVSIDSVDGSDGWEIGGEPQKGNNATKETAQRADDGTWFTAPPTPKATNATP